MAGFIANNSRKIFEQNYFSKLDKKEKKLQSKESGSIWDEMTKKSERKENKQ